MYWKWSTIRSRCLNLSHAYMCSGHIKGRSNFYHSLCLDGPVKKPSLQRPSTRLSNTTNTMKGEGPCILHIAISAVARFWMFPLKFQRNIFICLNRISRDYGLMMQQLSGFCRLYILYLCRASPAGQRGFVHWFFVWWLEWYGEYSFSITGKATTRSIFTRILIINSILFTHKHNIWF